MKTDFPTASVESSQAPTATVEKSHRASNTKIQTLPHKYTRNLTVVRYRIDIELCQIGKLLIAQRVDQHLHVIGIEPGEILFNDLWKIVMNLV